MTRLVSRRALLALAAAAPLAACAPGDDQGAAPATTASPPATPSAPPSPAPVDRTAQLTALEAEHGARLGVWALDTGSGRTAAHRADERFASCSTIKALAAGAVLQRRGAAGLDELVRFTDADLVPHSPVTQERVADGMSVRELCDAALRVSDNTAANLLLRDLGGPAALTAALRALGDDVTSVDRLEPDLNEAVPGDPRDTSTPRALGAGLQRFVLGDVLGAAERELLTRWLVESTTGTALVRAGVPAGWRVGDRSGSGSYGTRNDVAVVWPPGTGPLVVAVMSTHDDPDAEPDDALVASAAAVVVEALTGTPSA